MGKYANILAKAKGLKNGTYKIIEETNGDVKFEPETFPSGYQVSFMRPSGENTATVNINDDAKVKAVLDAISKKLDSKVYVGVFDGEPEFSFHYKGASINSAVSVMEGYNQHSIYDWENKEIIHNAHYDQMWGLL